MANGDTHTSHRLQRFFTVLVCLFIIQWHFYHLNKSNTVFGTSQHSDLNDTTSVQILGLEHLNITGKYAVMGANNCGSTRKKCPGLEYGFDILLSAKVWKTHGFGTIAVLTGDANTWKKSEPWSFIFNSLLEAGIISIIVPTPYKHSVGMSQFGRLFVSNFLKSKIDKNLDEMYLITTDSDFFPLLTHRLSLPENKTILATNPQTSWRDVSKVDSVFRNFKQKNVQIRGKRDVDNDFYDDWPKAPSRLPIYVAMSCVGATVNSLFMYHKI